jgi:hypothetical protein
VDHSTAIEAVDDEMRALTTVGPAPPWAEAAAAAAAAAAAGVVGCGGATKVEGDLAEGMAGRVEALPDPGLEAARSGDVAALRRLVAAGWGLMDNARHVIKRVLNPHLLSYMTFYDVASTIHQSLRRVGTLAPPRTGTAAARYCGRPVRGTSRRAGFWWRRRASIRVWSRK